MRELFILTILVLYAWLSHRWLLAPLSRALRALGDYLERRAARKAGRQ